jgi:ankyrin repeat protein
MNQMVMLEFLAFWLISLPMSETVDDVFRLCQIGRLEEVKKVVSPRNANFQRPDGTTLLMVAVSFNPNPEVVEHLIRQGAQVNSRTLKFKTALMIATEHNPRTEVIRLLLEAGSPLNTIDQEGKTALMYAARHNPNPEVVRLL